MGLYYKPWMQCKDRILLYFSPVKSWRMFFFSKPKHLLSLQDESDVVFRAATGKWRAVVVEISRMHKTGRPVLVGTTSVEQSDALSEQLREAGIPHEVCCQFHSQSSQILLWPLLLFLNLGHLPSSTFHILLDPTKRFKLG